MLSEVRRVLLQPEQSGFCVYRLLAKLLQLLSLFNQVCSTDLSGRREFLFSLTLVFLGGLGLGACLRLLNLG